ncbi:hypothetical protein G7046_g3642 [Stylonectria norvegica]|nr:hypothetical protein G7046_g3642 [Stylonectria norvegica]
MRAIPSLTFARRDGGSPTVCSSNQNMRKTMSRITRANASALNRGPGFGTASITEIGGRRVLDPVVRYPSRHSQPLEVLRGPTGFCASPCRTILTNARRRLCRSPSSDDGMWPRCSLTGPLAQTTPVASRFPCQDKGLRAGHWDFMALFLRIAFSCVSLRHFRCELLWTSAKSFISARRVHGLHH